MERKIKINSSARHIHVTREDLDILFGKGFELVKKENGDLIQPGEFASEQFVKIEGPKGCFPKVRILGPIRKYTQIEISKTDTYTLGLKNIPLRDSGDLEGSGTVKVTGPCGSIETNGVIIAQRHIHLDEPTGKAWGFKNGDWAKVYVDGDRKLIFDRVYVRVKSNFAPEMHVDADETNAAYITPDTWGIVEKSDCCCCCCSKKKSIASYIDHTLLKPEATPEQIVKLCGEAKEFNFASVCVNPFYVKLAHAELKDSPVKVCTVIGFPLGASSTFVKAEETRDAVAFGADEVDMVINVGAIKAKNYDVVKKDIEAVVDAAAGRLVKVILETCLLTDEEIVKACEISKEAGADFVKTSTGFSKGGATVEAVSLMRKTVGADMGVKASGGIRDYKTAKAMIEAGASRIGASAGIAIVEAEKAEKDN